MAADLYKMQDDQRFPEIRIDKLELLVYNLSMNTNSTLIWTLSIKYFCTSFSIIK